MGGTRHVGDNANENLPSVALVCHVLSTHGMDAVCRENDDYESQNKRMDTMHTGNSIYNADMQVLVLVVDKYIDNDIQSSTVLHSMEDQHRPHTRTGLPMQELKIRELFV